MKIDMHVHTKYSLDGRGELSDFIKTARKVGLHGLAITDHNEINGALRARKLAKNMDDFIIIVGEEVSTTRGHILAYNIQEKIVQGNSPAITIEQIKDAGGFAVAAHPGRFPSGIRTWKIKKLDFDGIETLNASSLSRRNKKAVKLANEMDLGTVGGSDAHKPRGVGRAYTLFKKTSPDVEDILRSIKKKLSIPGGCSQSYKKKNWRDTKMFFKWICRGGKGL